MTALAGLILSAIVLWTGAANMIIMAFLWVLYHSVNSVGQRWWVAASWYLCKKFYEVLLSSERGFFHISYSTIFTEVISSSCSGPMCGFGLPRSHSIYILLCSIMAVMIYPIINYDWFGDRYSFGWESQLLESGFLAIFLCPVWTMSSLPRGTEPPTVVIWAYRWLIFRIMIGAVSIEYDYDLLFVKTDNCRPSEPELLLPAALQVAFCIVYILTGYTNKMFVKQS